MTAITIKMTLSILIVSSYITIFVMVPVILSIVTQIRWWYTIRQQRRRSNDNNDASFSSSPFFVHSSIGIGRVWHTRFLPKIHAFTYPIFMFALDLSEVEQQHQSQEDKQSLNDKNGTTTFNDIMWPLSYIVSFRPTSDHLKNGEGRQKEESTATSQHASASLSLLSDRIFKLCAIKTNNKFCPNHTTHRVILLTHLCYYGYNFNPVSFYYVVTKEGIREHNNNNSNINGHAHTSNQSSSLFGGLVSAVVGEVSNTPWNEMYCYVLHPDSTDQVHVGTIHSHAVGASKTKNTMKEPMGDNTDSPQKTMTVVKDDDNDDNGGRKKEEAELEINYVFPKSFHVSPFMEMDYLYDWSFISSSKRTPNSNDKNVVMSSSAALSTTTSSSRTSIPSVHPTIGHSITVLNSLRREPRQTSSATKASSLSSKLAFRARLELDFYPITPWRVCCQIVSFPIFCFLIQIWIHYEAVWLFIKGIVYIPHPEGSETTASLAIATIMTPFFTVRDYFNPTSKTTTTTTVTDTSSSKSKVA